MAERPTCKACVHWGRLDWYGGEAGLCRRYPTPSVTTAADGCGEHQDFAAYLRMRYVRCYGCRGTGIVDTHQDGKLTTIHCSCCGGLGRNDAEARDGR